MNGKQIIILAAALAAASLILRHDLPLELPWVMLKVLMLFLKLFAVLAVAVFAYVAAGKKKPS